MAVFTVFGFILVALVAVAIFPRATTVIGISVLLCVWGIAFNSRGASIIPYGLNEILSFVLVYAVAVVGYLDVLVFKKLWRVWIG